MRIAASHTIEEINGNGAWTSDPGVPTCWNHPQPMTAFDTQCQRLVCSDCLMFGVHKGHDAVRLGEAAEDSRQRLPGLISDAEAQLGRVRVCEQAQQQAKASLSASCDQTEAAIRAMFEKVPAHSLSLSTHSFTTH